MPTTHIIGNFDPAAMTLADILDAIHSTWDTEVPAPHGVDPQVITSAVSITADANRNAGREMGYGSAFAWGLTVGVLAERNRLERTG